MMMTTKTTDDGAKTTVAATVTRRTIDNTAMCTGITVCSRLPMYWYHQLYTKISCDGYVFVLSWCWLSSCYILSLAYTHQMRTNVCWMRKKGGSTQQLTNIHTPPREKVFCIQFTIFFGIYFFYFSLSCCLFFASFFMYTRFFSEYHASDDECAK